MELLIPERALAHRFIQLCKVENVTVVDLDNQPVNVSDVTSGYINYEGVSIGWRYERELSKLSFFIATRQAHIPVIVVKEQILKWFG